MLASTSASSSLPSLLPPLALLARQYSSLSSSLSSTGSSIMEGEDRPWWVSTERARARGREGVPRAWWWIIRMIKMIKTIEML